MPVHRKKISFVVRLSGLMQGTMMGQSCGFGRVGEDDAGMEKSGVFKGLAPDNLANPLDLGSPVIGFEQETDFRIQVQQLPAGEADPVVAEVNGPGIILPQSGATVMAGNFGKTEGMATGDTDGAAAIGRGCLILPGLIFSASQQLVVGTHGMVAGEAVSDNVLVYWHKQTIFDQLAGTAARAPVRTGTLFDLMLVRCD